MGGGKKGWGGKRKGRHQSGTAERSRGEAFIENRIDEENRQGLKKKKKGKNRAVAACQKTGMTKEVNGSCIDRGGGGRGGVFIRKGCGCFKLKGKHEG